MEEYTVEVSGMSCESCESMVRDAVTSLRGVSSVTPDACSGEVTVRGESGTADRVRQAITELGYEAQKRTFGETPRTRASLLTGLFILSTEIHRVKRRNTALSRRS
ncbi:heavy-metal-associated domain-containing protein [Haladaptatus pallidirubidus]|uniref:HMA domain-containing protein n=1 Tax=Haladaptatus pallidirubidus TaxID=1008152 RepID=A0AAV3UM36_9EURY|nr:heavy metal-associated domain-containing protein [Haladaptatus pallidirubidus]